MRPGRCGSLARAGRFKSHTASQKLQCRRCWHATLRRFSTSLPTVPPSGCSQQVALVGQLPGRPLSGKICLATIKVQVLFNFCAARTNVRPPRPTRPRPQSESGPNLNTFCVCVCLVVCVQCSVLLSRPILSASELNSWHSQPLATRDVELSASVVDARRRVAPVTAPPLSRPFTDLC